MGHRDLLATSFNNVGRFVMTKGKDLCHISERDLFRKLKETWTYLVYDLKVDKSENSSSMFLSLYLVQSRNLQIKEELGNN